MPNQMAETMDAAVVQGYMSPVLERDAMSLDHVLRLVLLGSVIGIAVIDFVLFAIVGKDFTLSAVIYRSSKEYPAIPFSAGLLAGHLWWGQCL